LVTKKKTRRPARRRPSADGLDWLFAPVDFVAELWSDSLRALRGAAKAVRAQRPLQLFLLLFILAACVRLMRPDWYTNRTFHPDERWLFDKTAELHVIDARAGFPFIGEPGRSDGAGLQYGSLPLYVVSVFKDFLGLFHVDAYRASILCGRTVTGLVDTATVLLTFLLGVELLGAWPALLAAALLAGAPLSIQLSHFFTVDPWMTCFSVAVLYCATRVAKTQKLAWTLAAGLAYAAALACKSGALPLVLPILLGHLWPAAEPGLKASERSRRLVQAGIRIGIAAGVTVLGFAVFMPYAFLHFSKFLQNQTAQQGILVKGEPAGVPFVRQYWDTSIGFHLRNLSLFYFGLPTGLLAVLAVPLALGLGLWRGLRAWSPVVKPVRGLPAPEAPASLWQQAWAPLVLLSWALPYYLIVGTSFAKFARYMLPLLPVLALLLALVLQWLNQRSRRVALSLAGILAFFALGWGVGYGATYLRPHPWIEASRWTLENIPPVQKDATAPGGTRATRTMNEDWGDDLPVDVPGGNAGSYQGLKGRPDQVNIVEHDRPDKFDRLGNTLSQADVLFLADARAYGTYLRLPTRFPLTNAYYDLLFSDPGRLGFKRVHEASNLVRFFGLGPALDDSRIPSVPKWRWADESFTLYDRPHAFVFQRENPLTKAEVQAVLSAHIKELGSSDEWRNGVDPETLHLQATGKLQPTINGAIPPVEARINPNYGTSRGKFLGLGHPVLAWWLLVCVLGWLALPLSTRLFRLFPAGGYALSKALGVFLFAWAAYNLAWLRVLGFQFHQSNLWAFLGLLIAGGLWALQRRKAEAVAWVQTHRSEIIWSEAIFAGAFLFFVVVRAFNPNIHDITGQGYFGGGEPLGMTYLSAVMRASTFPLYDPWLALRDSSYYYFGYVIAGSIAKLAGFQASIAYNMALPLFFSLGLVSAYGLLRGLVAKRGLALAGAAMVSLAGNLWSIAYIAIQISRSSFPLNPVNIVNAWISHGFIWDPSRFPELINGHILEFPYFSYLYSDLHPHNMVVAFSLLLTALLLVPFKSALSGWRSLGERPGQALGWVFLTGLLLDAQYAINTWSWPVFFALSLGALLIGPWAGKRLKFLAGLKAAAWGLGAFVVMAFVGRMAMFGFRHYFLQDGANRLGSVQPNEWQMSAYIPLAVFLPGLLGLAYLAGRRLRDFGPSLAKDSAWVRLRRRGWFTALTEAPLQVMDRRPVFFWSVAAYAALSAVLLACVAMYYGGGGTTWMRPVLGGKPLFSMDVGAVTCLGLWLGLSCVALFSLRGWQSGREAFVWVLGGFCMFLVWGSEQYFVADRTNTLFKFWFNGWILMSVVAAAAFAHVFEAASASAAPRRGRAGRGARLMRLLPYGAGAGLFLAVCGVAMLDSVLMGHGGRFIASFLFFAALLAGVLGMSAFGNFSWVRPVGQGLFGGLLALGLVYPLGATLARITDTTGFRELGFKAPGVLHPHLDGLAFMAERQPRPQGDAHDYDSEDAALIEWLNSNPEADVTATLVEAPGLQMYQGYNRYAIYTGLPTLLGWNYQVGQQLGNRENGILRQRESDTAVIYGENEAAALALLKQYKVRWIVVGSLERRLYSTAGLEKFQHLAKEVQRSGQAVLYRFDADQP
jgi:uncharacterized membrane protein